MTATARVVRSRTAIRRRLAFLDRPLTSLHLILVTHRPAAR